MRTARMPFPRVRCEVATPTFSMDGFGNEVSVTDWDNAIVTECSYAPGSYTANTSDSFQPFDPSGDDVSMTFFLPKTFDADMRGATIRVDGLGEYKVVGDPRSYMREATPGDMSWCVVGVAHHG